MNLLSSFRPKPCDMAVAQEVVSSVVVLIRQISICRFPLPCRLLLLCRRSSYNLAKTPLMAAQAPLPAAMGIQGRGAPVVGAMVEADLRACGGGEGDGEGDELRSRSAGWALYRETSGSVAVSVIAIAHEGVTRACREVNGSMRRSLRVRLGTD